MSDLATVFAATDDALHIQNEANTPVAQAQAELLRQQAIDAAQKNRVAALQFQYMQQLPTALDAASKSGVGSASGMLPGDPAGFGAVETDDSNGGPGNAAGAQVPGTDGGSGHGLNLAKATAGFQQNYRPIPSGVYSPQEMQAMRMAALSGNTAASQYITANHEAQLSTLNGKRSDAARDTYNGLVGVNSAPDGHALDALSLIDPAGAQRLQDAGATDAEVRQWSAQLAGKLHTIAQLPVEYSTDGTAVDKVTQEPVLGFDHAVGLNAQQRADLAKSATEKVDSPNSDGTTSKLPRWKAEGADSASDWISDHMQLAADLKNGTASPPAAAPSPGAAPSGPPQGAPPVPTRPQGAAPVLPWLARNGGPPNAPPQAPAAGAAPGPVSNAPPRAPQSPLIAAAQKIIQVPQADGSKKAVPQFVYDGFPTPQAWVQHAASVAQQQGTNHEVAAAVMNAGAQAHANTNGPGAPAPYDPVLAKALADPEYKLQTPPVRAGVTQSPADADQAKIVNKAKSDLLDEQANNSKAAGQALRFYTLAQDVVNSGNVTTGWGAEKAAAAGSFLQQLGIDKSMLGDPSKSAELVKALTNAGLQNLKSTYGSKITQSEVFLNLQHANPNIDMPLPALRRLINDQTDNLKYDVQGAQQANKYLASGGDPQKFDTWRQQYFPRQSSAVTPSAPASANNNAPPVRVTSPDQARALQPGTRFVTPDGRTLVR
jgi:hypothetical protein